MTEDELTEAVLTAQQLERSQIRRLGRRLRPPEFRWLVKAAFRTKYGPRLGRVGSDVLTDNVIRVINVAKEEAAT